MRAPQNDDSPQSSSTSTGLIIAALGIVFGDIGTSPLYALREAFHGPHSVAITELHIFGVLSMILWTLTLVVAIKYSLFIMRADNKGEGGVLALTALFRGFGRDPSKTPPMLLIGLFGAALLFGDGIITPAVSILGAVEGLTVAAPVFSNYVVPLTLMILIALFLAQKQGTRRIGAVFGPIMVVWFITIAALGLGGIWQAPQVLQAINPLFALKFVLENSKAAFLVLGAVFLTVTGAEALYADMGHFGRRPIQLGWMFIVLPALVLNYFGQGALLLVDPQAAVNPFYHLVPDQLLYAMIFLSTLAAIIASQALISGVFSLTRQAIQLGYLPRVAIIHTSGERIGQIYIPVINWMLAVLTGWLVMEFQSSSNLAAAYGIAVSLTMAITTILAFFIFRRNWGWPLWKAGSFLVVFLTFDLIFFAANSQKMHEGGWVPILIGGVIFLLMTTWKRGRKILYERLRLQSVPLDNFIKNIHQDPPARVPGVAFFLTGDPLGTPPALIHNVKHNRVLHETVALLTITTKEDPYVSPEDRLEVKVIEPGFYRLTASYGFMDKPDMRDVIAACGKRGLQLKLEEITFFLGRETIIPSSVPGMEIWREKIFAFMSRNAERATIFYNIPPTQVIEVGLQVEL